MFGGQNPCSDESFSNMLYFNVDNPVWRKMPNFYDIVKFGERSWYDYCLIDRTIYYIAGINRKSYNGFTQRKRILPLCGEIFAFNAKSLFPSLREFMMDKICDANLKF